MALLKIGKLDHLEALREQGQIHCKTLAYFSTLEDTILRGDELEGVTTIVNLDGGTIQMKDVDASDTAYCKPIDIHTGRMFHRSEDAKGNIFCMYSIAVDKHELGNNHLITDEAKSFGDHFLVIKNWNEFLRRVAVKLETLGMTGKYGFITYKDFTKYHGKKTLFEKDLAFKPQQEFRIFIHNESTEPLDLYIGSIADISEIGCCIDLEGMSFYDINEAPLN